MQELFLSLFLIFVCVTDATNYCTQTQNEWLVRMGGNNNSMCGEGWVRLMQVDPARMLIEENRQWVIGFHVYATGYLNREALYGTNKMIGSEGMLRNFNKSRISEAIVLLGDNLERYCSNVSQWQLIPSLMDAMILVDRFNHGLIPGVHLSLACPSPPSSGTSNTSKTYYYYESADVLTTRDPATNMTYTYSLTRGLFTTNYFLYCFLLLSLFGNALQAIKMMMLHGQMRVYHLKNHAAQKGQEMQVLGNGSSKTLEIETEEEDVISPLHEINLDNNEV